MSFVGEIAQELEKPGDGEQDQRPCPRGHFCGKRAHVDAAHDRPKEVVTAYFERWFDAFLIAVREIASETCRPVLSGAGDLWKRCEADYRPGFKAQVRVRLKTWFEEQPSRSMHNAIEDGMQRAWIDNVVQPLEDALGTAVPKNDLFNESEGAT
jgi:hypothetical protein